MGKTINLLTPLTDSQVNNDNLLIALADPVSGLADSATMSQMKKTIGTQSIKYVTTGSEGTVLVIAAINQANVISIAREGAVIYEVVATPDPAEFIWDGTNITLGLTVNLAGGERFQILYDRT